MNKLGALSALLALGLGGGFLAGCGTTTNSGYTTTYDQYGRPVYATGVNSYGQPVDAYGRPVAVAQPTYNGDYVYYPDSEVYYSPTRRDYVYWDGNGWAHHGAPPRNWNQSSLSVHLNFGGGDPWMHHNEVIRRYPRHWHDRDRDRDRDWRRR